MISLDASLSKTNVSQILLDLLTDTKVLKPNKKVAIQDLKIGIPNVLLCLEMAIFAVLHLFAFPWRPYRLDYATPLDISGRTKDRYYGGPFGIKAYFDALNPWDFIKAVGRSTRWLFVGRQRRLLDPSYQYANDAFSTKPDVLDTEAATSYQSQTGYDSEEFQLLSHAQPEPISYPEHMAGVGKMEGDVTTAHTPSPVHPYANPGSYNTHDLPEASYQPYEPSSSTYQSYRPDNPEFPHAPGSVPMPEPVSMPEPLSTFDPVTMPEPQPPQTAPLSEANHETKPLHIGEPSPYSLYEPYQPYRPF